MMKRKTKAGLISCLFNTQKEVINTTNIQGTAVATIAQMQSYIKRVNSKVAQSVINMIPYYISEGEAEGIRGDIAFAQSCLETGNFTFSGSAVSLSQNNFAGMGVTQTGMKGESWNTPQEGIRAQIQHLKAYATNSPLNNVCADKRYVYVDKGCAPYVEWLGIQENPKRKGWAAGKNYGTKILNILNTILQERTGETMNIIETYLSFDSLSKRGVTRRAVLHHAEAKTCTPQQIHQWHKNNGWAGAGYHFLVRKDGKIYRLRPEWAVGAHAEGSNSDSIGICFEGSFMSETMGQAQINAGRELVAYLKGKYGFSKVQAHRDVCSTNCPGKNFPFTEVTNTSAISSPTKNYLSKGDNGAAVKELQELLNKAGNYGLKADGDFGDATDKAVRDYQKKHNLGVDGCAGTATMASLREVTKDKNNNDIAIGMATNGLVLTGSDVNVRTEPETGSIKKSLSKGTVIRCDKRRWVNGSCWFHYADGWVSGKYLEGWVKESNKWWYLCAGYTYPKSAWKQVGKTWYYFDASGWMKTGWLQIGDKWYWLKSSGAMAHDEMIKIGKEIYYFLSDGHMARTNARGALV